MNNIFSRSGKDYLQNIVNQSKSISQILKKFNYTKSKAGYDVLINTLNFYQIDYSHIYKNKNHSTDFNKKPIETYLIENSKATNSYIKKRLFDEGLLENKCFICGIDSSWNNKSLSLQLDHINGINNDNRIENLRILCPNCHSQTDTFSGKHKRKNFCIDCNKQIKYYSERCFECSQNNNKSNSKEQFIININELQDLLWKLPMVKIAEIYGCSDKTIAKKIKKYNLTKPATGYFIKK